MTVAAFLPGSAGTAAIAIAIAVCAIVARWRRRHRAMLLQWPSASPERGRKRSDARAALLIIAAICLGASVVEAERQAQGVGEPGALPPPVLFLLDVSRSMDVADLKPSRQAAAVEIIRQVVSGGRPLHAGLMIFAGEAMLACPLTTDRRAVEMALDDLPNSVGSLAGGSALDLALAEALRTLLRIDPRGSIVLLSDGENTTGELAEVIALAAASRIPVHAIGMGTVEGGVMEVRRRQSGVNLEPPERRLSRLDVTALQGLATSTSGSYLTGEGDETARQLDVLIAASGPSSRAASGSGLARLLLWAALAALLLELTLRKAS